MTYQNEVSSAARPLLEVLEETLEASQKPLPDQEQQKLTVAARQCWHEVILERYGQKVADSALPPK
jgi:hypothetical protein